MTYPISADQAYWTAAEHNRVVKLLTGPFDSHAEAARALDDARSRVRQRFALDMNATFATFGVALAPRNARHVFPAEG